MKKNVSGQKIGATLVSATDGSAFAGSVTVYVTVDAGTQAQGTVGSGAATNEGNSYYTYAPSQAETNGDLVAFTFIGTGAVPATVQVYTSFPQTADAPAVAAIADAVWDEVRSGHTTAGTFGEVSTPADVADAIWDEARSGHTTAGTFGQGVASVQGNVTGSVASVAGAVGSVTSGVTVTTNNDKTGYALSAAGVDAVWDEAIAGHAGAGSTGAALSAATAPSAAAVADAVWGETITDHLGAGTTGAALNAAGSAGDPWSTPLPGAYGDGTAGKIIGDNINAPVGTVDTVVDAIKAKTDLLAFTGTDVKATLDSELVTLAAATHTGAVIPTVTTITDKTGFSLSAAGVDAIHDEVVDGSTTLRQSVCGINSALMGKVSGAAGTTVSVRDLADTKDRLVVTVDSDHNRTAITRDLT